MSADANRSSSREGLEREVALTDAVIGAMDVSVGGEDERQRVFGDRLRGVRRNAYHRHADTVRGVHVDVVEAGTAQRDDPHAERRQPGHG